MKGNSPTISALNAYSPSAASAMPRCPNKCGEYLVVTLDAIGRPRERCPKCDGVSKRRPPHPDEVLIPQTLLSPAQLLPAVRPGQLRCQRCARGVDGERRFCDACERGREHATKRIYKPKPCRNPQCRTVFQPTGPRSDFCSPACKATTTPTEPINEEQTD